MLRQQAAEPGRPPSAACIDRTRLTFLVITYFTTQYICLPPPGTKPHEQAGRDGDEARLFAAAKKSSTTVKISLDISGKRRILRQHRNGTGRGKTPAALLSGSDVGVITAGKSKNVSVEGTE
jgi:hypothetical protein